MDKNTIKQFKEFIKRIEKVNNQTENKIDVLKTILKEYDDFSTLYNDFESYSIKQNIKEISDAKTKRKNVGKKYLHQEFLRIKDDSLFKIKYNCSMVNFKIEKNKI